MEKQEKIKEIPSIKDQPLPEPIQMTGRLIDGTSMIGGRKASTIAEAINASGNFLNEIISTNLDTKTKEILGDFTFGASGAIEMITDADNGLWLSPTGILGKKDGATTFAIGIDGSPTFAGVITAGALIVGTAASTIETGATSNLPSDENLIGYWSFDEGTGAIANDGSDNNNDGTLTNMENADWVSGIVGTCLHLDGNNECIVVAHSTDLNTTTAMSISVWVYLDQLKNYQVPVAKRSGASTNYQIHITASGGLYFEEYGSSIKTYSFGNIISATTWTHIVITFNSSGNVIAYKDGVAQTPVAAERALTVNVHDLLIGRDGEAGSNYFDGKIDELRIYDVELTAKEAYALYKNPSGLPSLAVPIGRVTSGSIYSKQITLAITAGTGDSYIRGGSSFDMANWRGDDAFILGLDDSDSDKAKFFIGNYTSNKYLKYEQGGDLVLKGGSYIGNSDMDNLEASIFSTNRGGAAEVNITQSTGIQVANSDAAANFQVAIAKSPGDGNNICSIKAWDNGRVLQLENTSVSTDEVCKMIGGVLAETLVIEANHVTNSDAALRITHEGTGEVLELRAQNTGGHLLLTGDPTVASPADGEIWFDGTNLKIRIGATTYNIDKTAV